MTDWPYRRARPAAVWWNVVKTLVELAVLWFAFIIALPIGISVVEVELGVQRFPGLTITAAIAMGLFALLGIYAALTLAISGRGTPLPMDEARRLVVTGPYAYTRNPIAIAALGQASALGAALGSLPVLIYVAIMTVWWYYRVRPREERHLAERYGKRWKAYADEVRSVRPRLRPYRPQ